MYSLLILMTFFPSIISVSVEIPSLPHCPDTKESGVVIVSTLDGKLSALNSTGSLVWQLETGPGPLLLSNIHKLELTNNGEWVRIIPSLTGTLYKFDGSTIDPIPITAEELLKSSFRYSDDLVIAGGIDVRTYGVGFRSGTLYYECTSVKCSNKDDQNVDDVLLIERSTHTIRAVEPRTGTERWNFSVGLHNVKLPKVSCINPNIQLFNWNVTAVLPEGKIKASISHNDQVQSWIHTFSAPIVRVWRWTGKNLVEINLFAPRNMPNIIIDESLCPSIYLAMHNKQLYVHESAFMQRAIRGKISSNVEVSESRSIAKIPWKPIPASAEKPEEDSTALSVLNGSEYVNGQGFYLFSEKDQNEKDTVICQSNDSYVETLVEKNDARGLFYLFCWYGKEISLMAITLIICHFLFRMWHQQRLNPDLLLIQPVERQIVPVSNVPQSNIAELNIAERRISERENDSFSSRYLNDFETIRCLGKGGFGVVFEVKQKYDEQSYAIKRITLPNEGKSRERVMREVKALAKLEHQNIVRYFCSWVENPPSGWQHEHDKIWMGETSMNSESSVSTFTHKEKRSKSVSISIDVSPIEHDSELPSIVPEMDDDEDEDDSYIVFENSPGQEITVSESDKDNSVPTEDPTSSTHSKKKINWRRPSRRHHSWDLRSKNNSLEPKDPPVFLYIQMQLCQKDSLKEWLRTNSYRDYDFVIDIFSQILEAVQYVHLQGLIHRDLKPGNIFFSLEGKIKVGDFGLVKDMEDPFDLDQIKKGSSPHRGHTIDVGTHLYMSPEQLESRSYNYKVDIYSLGIILFELLVPFSTEMERGKMLSNLKKNKFPEDFQQKFPNEYDLLQNMLCKEPNKRLTTIGIMSRPPFNRQDSGFRDECHYQLTSVLKN
nr:eukaryotic translation initiation factor 2-alpha kinase [Leptinotarsa decemlineata]